MRPLTRVCFVSSWQPSRHDWRHVPRLGALHPELGAAAAVGGEGSRRTILASNSCSSFLFVIEYNIAVCIERHGATARPGEGAGALC